MTERVESEGFFEMLWRRDLAQVHRWIEGRRRGPRAVRRGRVLVVMKVAIALFALCACDRALGIKDTRLWDAPPPDAPFSCPPIGTAPRFSSAIHQQLIQPCDHYVTTPSGFAMANCIFGGKFVGQLAEGQVGAELVASPGFFEPNDVLSVDEPRPTPDGQSMIVRSVRSVGPATFASFDMYHRDGEGWKMDSSLPFPSSIGNEISTIAQDSGGLLLIRTPPSAPSDEWRFDGASWSLVRTYDPQDFAPLTFFSEINLSSDGLRAVLYATERAQAFGMYQTYYMDRATTADKLAHPHLLAEVPASPNGAYLDDTCAHIYFDGLDSVFYAQPQ